MRKHVLKQQLAELMKKEYESHYEITIQNVNVNHTRCINCEATFIYKLRICVLLALFKIEKTVI